MVYEAAEEANEEWVAIKESSEFIDEYTIVIYKEGFAPQDVLDELNQGELPMEIIGQQRAIAEERKRQQIQQEKNDKMKKEQQIHEQQKKKNKKKQQQQQQNNRIQPEQQHSNDQFNDIFVSSNMDLHPNDNEEDEDEEDEDDIAVLNTKKRDRRTMEDYQRDKQRKK